MVSALSKFISENSIRGFLAEAEGDALYEYALKVADLGPCLEIGSYCGKSTVYLGKACQQGGNSLYAVDHHRGSEEHQLGEEYHDPELYDALNQCMDSFPQFRRTLKLAELEDTVVPIVASSQVAARHWVTPLGMIFVDGGHSPDNAMADCVLWSEHVVSGGIVAVHDLFEHPSEGGQGPFLAFQRLVDSGVFRKVGQCQSLGFMQRVG